MSEPITLTERERAVFGSMIEYVRERCRNNARDGNQASGNAVSRWMEDWLASQPTESASPPRVPGASAQLAREGVQSGPGQPTDIVERLERIRSMIGKMCREGRPPAMTVPADPTRDEDLFIADAADEAAAEIRRLRAAIDECLEAAGIPVGQAEHYVTVPALIADKIGDMEDYAAIRYRAGIEAAARHLAATKVTEHLADEVRALADKPAPDERKRCLEIVQRHIDAEVRATFANGATLQDAFTAGCEMTAKAIFDDIAGTQRFATPIVNIDGDVKQERFDAPFAARKGD